MVKLFMQDESHLLYWTLVGDSSWSALAQVKFSYIILNEITAFKMFNFTVSELTPDLPIQKMLPTVLSFYSRP